jgi:hypothetical protein
MVCHLWPRVNLKRVSRNYLEVSYVTTCIQKSSHVGAKTYRHLLSAYQPTKIFNAAVVDERDSVIFLFLCSIATAPLNLGTNFFYFI